jgi:hypothetical protein
MMSLFFAAATAALPAADLKTDLRCVAVLGVYANPKLKEDGAYFAAIVGAEIMDATGKSREAVRDMMRAEAAAVRKAGGPRPAEISFCAKRAFSRIAAAQ